MAAFGPDLRSDDLEAEIERLHVSIDRLSDVVVGLKEDGRQQAARTQNLAEKQAADFRSLLTTLHENYAKLVDRQDAAFMSFADRFDKLVERQDTASKSFADRLDKLVERKDTHFRWLAGLVVASALSVGIAVIKLH